MQSTSTASDPYLYNNGSRQALQEHPPSFDAGRAAKPDHAYGDSKNGDHGEDDGFGDFAVADDVSLNTATAPAAVTLQSADRWVLAYL